MHHQRLQHALERFARYRGSLRSSEQASQTHVDALFKYLFEAREQTEPAEARCCAGSMKVPFIVCCSCSLTRKVVHTAELSGSHPRQQDNPPPAAIWNKAFKNGFSGSGNQLWQSRPTGAHLSRQASLSGACLKHLLEVIADDHLPFFHFQLADNNIPQRRQTGNMGTAAGISRQIAKSHRAQAISKGDAAR